MEKVINLKQNIPLFEGMTKQDIQSVLSCVGGFVREFKKDEFIFLEEERVNCVGCVLNGSVQMIREDIWGNRTVLITIGEAELFGESFACGSQLNASVSFKAGENSKILFLPFQRVMYSCSGGCTHHQRLMVNMVAVMAEKNVALMSKIDILSKKTLREKIGAYLLQQASYHNSKYFTIPMGRSQLAEYLNVDRSALTRELSNMKEDGYIDFEKNTFRILKSLVS